MDKFIDEYKKEVNERLSKRMEDRYGTKPVAILSFLALVFVNLVAYFAIYKIWNIDTANQFVVAFLIGTLFLYFVMLILPPIIWKIYEIPEEIYCENRKDIENKQKEIDELVEQGKSLTPQKLSFDMGTVVQEFEKNFMGITSNISTQEIKRLFAFSGHNLDELIEQWLPKAKLVLKNVEEVKKSVYLLISIRNEYYDSFVKFVKLVEDKEEWWKNNEDGISTPKEIAEPLIETMAILWGVDEKSCNVKMQLAIDSCLSSLRQNM